MAETEELRILLTTVAAGNGAAQTRDQLNQVRTAATAAQSTLTGVSAGFRSGAADALRFAGALTGVTVGLSLATAAGNQIRESFAGAITAQAEAQRTARATAAAYGESATQFTRFATALSAQTGFTSQSILEAALSARTLSQNYGLTIQQTQNLIRVSADLAQVRGIGLAQSFERIQSAIRGEAEASEFLGLTLNDTFIKNNAANGAFRNTFETMTDAQKAQIRYTEALRQTAAFQGLAAQSSAGLDGAMNRANTAAAQLSVTLGKLVEKPFKVVLEFTVGSLNIIERTLQEADFIRNPLEFFSALGAEIGADQGRLNDQQRRQLLEFLGVARGTRTQANTTIPNEEVTLRMEEAEKAQFAAIDAEKAWRALGSTFRIVDETMQRNHRTIAQVAADVESLSSRIGQLSSITSALDISDVGARASTQVAADIARIDARINALRVEAALQRELNQEREASKVTDPRDAAGSSAAIRDATRERVRLAEQLLPIEQAIAEARRNQAEISAQVAAAQGTEALAILQILPQRQEIARLEREIANSVDRRITLRQEETRLLAQQRALQPNNALDDSQFALQRARLTLQIRGLPAEERSAARREVRDLTRNVLPGQERNALDANRNVALAQRQENATNIANQLATNAGQQQLEPLRRQAQAGEDLVFALGQTNERLNLLNQVANALTAAADRKLQVFVSGQVDSKGLTGASAEDAAEIAQQVGTQVYNQLIEANGQAAVPPVIPASGVRR